MQSEIKKSVELTDLTVRYDASAKRILSQKIILAYILVHTVPDFKGMKPSEVVKYIEGEPHISSVPVEGGMTNSRITGLNTENEELNEGLIRFDIIFYVKTRDGLTQIIVNVEAQKSTPNDYDIINRAIFYVCRMISSQKEREFTHSNYDDIKKVYSIWICMDMKENSLNHIHLINDSIICAYEVKGNPDLLNIVMIGLGKEIPKKEENQELHRLLGALLSQGIRKEEKLEIINKEYDIPLEEELYEEVNTMCNLGEGLAERAIRQGLEQGRALGIEQGVAQERRETIKNMLSNELPKEIMLKLGYSEEKISQVENEMHLNQV